MVGLSAFAAVLAVSPLFAGVAAHPGGHSEEEIQAEIALRNIVAGHTRRALEKCSNSPAALALQNRALARRAAVAQAIREKRGLENRM